MTPTHRFRQLKSPEDIQISHSHNYEEWGRGGLEREIYLNRERHLGSQPISKDHIRYWTLEIKTDPKDPSDGLWTNVSFCESLSRPAFYKIKGQAIDTTVVHSIGAVFTPKEYRGKGYAKLMLKQLIAEFDNIDPETGAFAEEYKCLSQQAVDNSASLLWSDVGLYYEQFGYKEPSGHKELVIYLGDSKPTTRRSDSHVTMLREDDIEAISNYDINEFKKGLDILTEGDGTPRFCTVPSAQVHEMTHARAHFVAPVLRQDEYSRVGKKPAAGSTLVKNVEYFGCQLNGMALIWSQDIGNNKLNVLRSVLLEDFALCKEEALENYFKLLEAAVEDAGLWNLKKVTLWEQDLPMDFSKPNAPIFTLKQVEDGWNQRHEEKGAIEERADSWTMYRPLHGKGPNQLVFAGKYAWF